MRRFRWSAWSLSSCASAPPSNQLLVASEQPIDIAAGGTQRFDLREVVRPDLARLIGRDLHATQSPTPTRPTTSSRDDHAIGASTPMPAPRAVALRAALDASRAALLASIGTLAERDFASSLPSGETVVAALAELAPPGAGRGEGRSCRHRRACAAPPRRRRDRRWRAPLPPQVIHDLAGARYET